MCLIVFWRCSIVFWGSCILESENVMGEIDFSERDDMYNPRGWLLMCVEDSGFACVT